MLVPEDGNFDADFVTRVWSEERERASGNVVREEQIEDGWLDVGVVEAEHYARRKSHEVHASGLAHERERARHSHVALDYGQLVVLGDQLQIERPIHLERCTHLEHYLLDLLQRLLPTDYATITVRVAVLSEFT